MPNESNVPERFSTLYSTLEKMGTQELKSLLVSVLGVTAENIAKAAVIISLLEARGVNLNELRLGLIGYLRKVACGQVLPEVIAQFVGSTVLSRICNLPIIDQQKCLKSEGVEIATVVGGQVQKRCKPLLLLEPFEARQLFAGDHIRDVDEQAAWLRSQEFQTPELTVHVEPPPYSIVGRELVVNRPVRLNKRELKRLLESIGD